eukprot:m.273432 g.273432  ORF g.273432 m.273432 type:complete len:246 (+) comp54818_c1_seq2:326-1063(+)
MRKLRPMCPPCAQHTPRSDKFVCKLQIEKNVNDRRLSFVDVQSLDSAISLLPKTVVLTGTTPTAILTNATILEVLGAMLPFNRRACRILVNSTDMPNSATFADKVFGRGQILAVFKTLATGAIFGGYIEDTFANDTTPVSGHTNNFIFRLGQQPIKLVLNRSSNDGVVLDSNQGLIMGGGPDLFAYSALSAGKVRLFSYRSSAAGYVLPSPLTSTTLTDLSMDGNGASLFDRSSVVAELFQCGST